MYQAVGRYALIGLFCVSCTDLSATQDSSVVQIGDTLVEGISYANGVSGFLGLPFAAPPIGPLRWEAPIPWRPTETNLDATRFKPACSQSGSGLAWYHDLMRSVGADPADMPAPEYDEDCLYLNVWTELKAPSGRPVIVFIHGGSNTGGWSYEPNYHGEKLAAEGVVVVTVAYRLGIFGWFAHPDLNIQNAALHDLAAALDWINQHIAVMGGDPNNITVSGESAGAANAIHLALSPLAKNRIARVIHQSAGWQVIDSISTADAQRRGLQLQHKLLGDTGSLSDLKAVSAEQLMAAAAEVYDGFYFDPVKDRDSFPQSVSETIASQSLPKIDLIIGTNSNEELMYVQPSWRAKDYLEGRIPEQRWPLIESELAKQPSDLAAMDALGTALDFTCPSLMLANAVSKSDGQAWVYHFERVRPGLSVIGAYHGAELPYIFNQHDAWLPTDRADHALTGELQEAWVAFATSGNPNHLEHSDWPKWDQQLRLVRRLDHPSKVDAHPFLGLCNALDGMATPAAY